MRVWPTVLGSGYAVLCLALIMVALMRATPTLFALAAVAVLLPLGAYLLQRAPQAVASVPGLVLGFMPFAALPGTGMPLVILLAAFLVPLAVLRPARGRSRAGALGVAILVYLAISLIACIAAFTGARGIWEYVKWAIATATTLVVLLLERPIREALLKGFVAGAALGAVVTTAMLTLDPSGAWVDRFGFLGYGGSAAVNARTATVDGSQVLRASGLYVDPNSAGIVFLVAAGIVGTVYRGTRRAVLLAALTLGIGATLSRSAYVSFILAIVVLVLFSRLDAGRRLLFVIIGILGFAAVTFIPAISSRLLDSFNAADVGASARQAALANYPTQMSGSWLFGHGWYLREFYDPVYGYRVNYAANTPLIVIYRGGIFAGLAFVVILLIALVLAVRIMRTHAPGAGLLGGVLFGLVFVAFQLDFPVVTMPPLAMAFALLLAQLQALGRTNVPPPEDGTRADETDLVHRWAVSG